MASIDLSEDNLVLRTLDLELPMKIHWTPHHPTDPVEGWRISYPAGHAKEEKYGLDQAFNIFDPKRDAAEFVRHQCHQYEELIHGNISEFSFLYEPNIFKDYYSPQEINFVTDGAFSATCCTHPGLPPARSPEITQSKPYRKLTGLQSSYQQRPCRVVTGKVK